MFSSHSRNFLPKIPEQAAMDGRHAVHGSVRKTRLYGHFLWLFVAILTGVDHI
jgi:hypothetical protein